MGASEYQQGTYNMIGYVTVGTNNFERAVSFFDKLLVVLGETRLWQTKKWQH